MLKRTRFPRRVPVVILTVVMLLSLVAFPASGAPAPTPPGPPITGFTAEKSAWERGWEAKFKAIPDPAVAQADSQVLSSHSVMYTSPGNYFDLQWSVAKLREYGLKPEVMTYYPYTSVPITVNVEMLAPTRRMLKVKENGWPWQQNFEDIVIGFNAFSPSGDVTADVVYANQGLEADYAQLAKLGVDVKGKIVLVRYGGAVRGAKHALAHNHGAAGVVVYSDPIDDGCNVGDVYPTGPWRPADGIQRGGLTYIWEYPGDALTPGWAATKDAPRLSPDKAENIPQDTPMTPIAYGEAAPLLQALGGPVAPDSWQGGLSKGDPRCGALGMPNFAYHIGPGPTKVHLKVQNDNRIKPVYDIIVKIPGSKYPDQMVVLGGHRDGWAYGTGDSVSGFITVLEMARAFAQLQKQGWKPERTIVLAGWDAEEPFELGSVEWGEQFQHALRANAVAYVNLDGAGGGTHFYAAGVPALDQLTYDITKDVEEPRTPGHSIYEAWVSDSGGQQPEIGREGGGSDFSVFINYIGMPTMELGFYTPGGEYHSAYDDLYHMEKWGDPGYLHHAAAARVAGLAAMRLANADILPLKYSSYAQAVNGYLADLNSLQVKLYGKEIVSFAREMQQAQAWQTASADLETKAQAFLDKSRSLPLRGLMINKSLMLEERELTQREGVPGRPWFKHMIYATSVYSGYDSEALPALTDGVRAGNWAQVRHYQSLLRQSLTAATITARVAALAAR